MQGLLRGRFTLGTTHSNPTTPEDRGCHLFGFSSGNRTKNLHRRRPADPLTFFLRALLKGGVVEAHVGRPRGPVAAGVSGPGRGRGGRAAPQPCLWGAGRPGGAGHHRSLVPALTAQAFHVGLLTPRPGTPFTKQQASVC